MRGARRAMVVFILCTALVACVVAAAPASRSGGMGGVLTISDASVTEGNAGTAALIFTVRLSGPVKRPARVSFGTASRGATAPADYATKSGRLTLDKINRTRTVRVRVVGDTRDEQDEKLVVR